MLHLLLYNALTLMCKINGLTSFLSETFKTFVSSCLTGQSCFKVTAMPISIHNPTKLLVSVSVTNRTVVLRLWSLCKHLLHTVVGINYITSFNIKPDRV